MGVSLERVQFKFASIIGELCNEPDVLSQFAVWLDLRLAEYKLKGNISLDCSGEEPDPIWLKGLNKIKNRILGSSPSHSRRSSSHHHQSHQIQDIPISQTSDNIDRDSPEILVVKDEPSDVYPVGVPYSSANSPGSDSRKRGAVSNNSPFGGDQWSTPSKQRRLSQPVESPSNQSLMSVLSGYQGDTQESESKVDNSSVPTTSSSMAATDSLMDNSGQFSDSSFNTSQSTTLQDIGWVGQPSTSSDTGNGNAHEGSPIVPRSQNFDHRKSSTREMENLNRRSKILPERLHQIPRQTVTSMTAAVGTFERWFQKVHPEDQRQFIEIPPEELNPYLAQFFKVILLPSGADYKPESFHSLKCYLLRYLRETGYDSTRDMFHSPVFSQAKQAFKAKKRYLETLEKSLYKSV